MFDELKAKAEYIDMLKKAGDNDPVVAARYGAELVKALAIPLRKGLFDGPVFDGVFERIPVPGTNTPEFPLHWLQPGTEKEWSAFTIPDEGKIPHKQPESDKVMVPTYRVGCMFDLSLEYLRFARWDVMGTVGEALTAQIVKKQNDDSAHTLLAAAVDRNIVIYDADAAAGQFTKRLISLAKTIMRRNGGGNSSSGNRSRLTDVFMSPEGMEDIRNWGVDQVDEITRREIYLASDDAGSVNRIFGVNLHDYDEFGQGQAYNQYYLNELSGTLPTDDVEIMLGLDLGKRDSFIMPVSYELELFEDPTVHRMGIKSWYGWQRHGFASLDGRRCVLLSI